MGTARDFCQLAKCKTAESGLGDRHLIPTRLRNHQLCRVRFPNRLRSPAAETDSKMCWHYWPPTNIREKCEDFGRFAPGRWHICQIAQIDFAFVWSHGSNGCHIEFWVRCPWVMFGSASRELELRFMGKCARLEENPHTLESHVLLSS